MTDANNGDGGRAGVVEVIQADREAAAEFAENVQTSMLERFAIAAIRKGQSDDSPIVQAFARHRIAALTAKDAQLAALREALAPFALAAMAGAVARQVTKDRADELRAQGATSLQFPEISIAVSIAQDKVSWADWAALIPSLTDQPS